MKATLENSRLLFILLMGIILLSSCSTQDENNHTEGGKPVIDREEPENNMTSNSDITNDDSAVDVTEQDIPASTFTTSKMQAGSMFFITSMDISSDIEKEIMDTLSEFNAVGVEDGAMMTLPEEILFDFDSAELRSDADSVIDQLKQIMDEVDSDMTIVGHTDSKGEDNYNKTLSEERANAVLEALTEAGVEKDRMTSEGKGASDPVASNTHSDGSDNPDGRQKNRRVEITVHGINQ